MGLFSFGFSYFADTLANQEASRHHESIVPGGATSSCDLTVDSSDLIGVHRPVTASARIATSAGYNSNPNHQSQHCRSRINEISKTSLGKSYHNRIGTSLSCGAYHVTYV